MTANVAPALCSQFQEATLSGDYARALELQDRLAPLHNALFIEPNPTGVKYALSLIDKLEYELRLPMVQVAPATRTAIRDAMIHAGLLN